MLSTPPPPCIGQAVGGLGAFFFALFPGLVPTSVRDRRRARVCRAAPDLRCRALDVTENVPVGVECHRLSPVPCLRLG